jgi:high-affinity iron transporter
MNRNIWLLGAAAAVLAAAVACTEAEDSREAAEHAAATAKPAAASAAAIDRGKALYKVNCVACHGESGKGDGPAAGALKPAPRDHTDRAYMSTLTNEEIGKVIQMGGAIKGKPLMPSHPQLRGADLDALVAYVRSLSAGH